MEQESEQKVTIGADLHNHLRTGRNPFNMGFDKTIDIAAKRLGPGGVFGIAGFDDPRYEDFLKMPGRYDRKDLENATYIFEKDILIIKGQEVQTKQGEMLVFGLRKNEFLKSGRPIEDFFKEAEDFNVMIKIPHPFFVGGAGEYLKKFENLALLRNCHAIEVKNGNAWVKPFSNKKAQMFYWLIKEEHDLGALVSTDGHSSGEIGLCYSLLEREKIIDLSSPEKIVDFLKSVRKHKDYSNDRFSRSYLGATRHSFKALKSKLSK